MRLRRGSKIKEKVLLDDYQISAIICTRILDF